MLIAKFIFGVLMIVLAIIFGLLVRHSRRDTLAQTAKLCDPDVKRRWIEHDQPECLALTQAIRIGACCFGLFGLSVVGLAVFN